MCLNNTKKDTIYHKNHGYQVQKVLSLVMIVGLVLSLALPLSIKAQFGQFELNSMYISAFESTKVLENTILSSARDIQPQIFIQKAVEKPDLVIRAVVTAYTSTIDQTDDSPFIAATGKRVYDGMIAANHLPFGTKIKIPDLFGEKVFTVDDRMNSRYGLGRMDIWMDATRQEAMQFGVKYVEAEIYYPEYTLVMR